MAASAGSLYHAPYSAATNYEMAANAVPNGIYAATGPHPSERDIGALYQSLANSTSDNHVQMDFQYAMGNFALHSTTEYDSKLVGTATKSHHYTFTTCENIGACTFAGAIVGHSCTGTDRGQSAKGFCYESSAGSLQCGRAIETFGRFSTTPTPLAYSMTSTVSRCPAGIPLDYPGKLTTRSLMVGGCMITTDDNFRPTANLHVPEDCAASAPNNALPLAQQGCLFPGAVNFAPNAAQSTKCKYNVNGCTSSTALNYNSEAYVNDGSCVEPVVGCTLASAGYADVNGVPVSSGDPMYKGRYVGLARANMVQTGRMGIVPYAAYGSVTDYVAGANVMPTGGCAVAVEGCTDSTKANYDPLATVNTNTWCIPVVTGCMMPGPTGLKTATAQLAGRDHSKDGGSSTYSAAATVNVVASCTVYRLGCTASSARNYDVHATVDDGSCWYSRSGCLDRTALNFNCALVSYATCTPTQVEAPTTHDAGICTYTTPPPTPPPPFPPGAAVRQVLKMQMTLAGTLSDFPESKIASISQAVADRLNIDVSRVTAILTAGSVNVEIQVATEDTAQASTFSSTLAADFASPAAASNFFTAAGVPGVEVLSTPVLAVAIVEYAAPPSPPPEAAAGAVIGGVIGAIVAVVLIGFIGFLVMKRGSAKATYPA